MQLLITTPRGFNFKRTVISHGWSELLPFEFDQAGWELKRVLDLEHSDPVTVTIKVSKQKLEIDSSRKLSKRAIDKVARDTRHMLRLDEDMRGFYREMGAAPEFEWIVQQGAGRLLRSPTVFEDLVKMICTTNCSWALTEKMVTGLVENLGRKSNDGRRTFPTPEAMALMPLKFYVNEVRAGYRSAYLKELAERVAAGSLRVEEWLASPLPTVEVITRPRTC
jgi:3-methyladenine DNA glycosylase/8-oxoguanine DNA glycosylase